MAQNILHIEVVSPEGIVYQGEATAVFLPTPDGEIEVLPHHIPLFTKLADGEVRVQNNGRDTSFAITGGFLEVNKKSLIILSDYAIRAESIQVAKAEEAKRRAEKLLEEKHEDVDFEIISKDLQKSILELNVAEKIKRRSN